MKLTAKIQIYIYQDTSVHTIKPAQNILILQDQFYALKIITSNPEHLFHNTRCTDENKNLAPSRHFHVFHVTFASLRPRTTKTRVTSSNDPTLTLPHAATERHRPRDLPLHDRHLAKADSRSLEAKLALLPSLERDRKRESPLG